MTDQHTAPDETQPHPTGGADAPASSPEPRAFDRTATDPAATDPAAADATSNDATATSSTSGGLRADPSRPSDPGWREPAWFPPKERARERQPSPVAIVVGLVLIAVGLYLFVDRTLGVALPRIPWGAIWPILLIVIGGVVLVRSVNRRT